MNHRYRHSFVVEVVGEEFSDHICSSFAAVMAIITATFFLCP